MSIELKDVFFYSLYEKNAPLLLSCEILKRLILCFSSDLGLSDSSTLLRGWDAAEADKIKILASRSCKHEHIHNLHFYSVFFQRQLSVFFYPFLFTLLSETWPGSGCYWAVRPNAQNHVSFQSFRGVVSTLPSNAFLLYYKWHKGTHLWHRFAFIRK